MDIYVLAMQPSAVAGSILVTDPGGKVQATFRRPMRPLLGCFTVVAATLTFLVTFVALLAAIMHAGDGHQRAVDQGSILAAVGMVVVVALTFALPIFISFVIVYLCYPRFWFTLWNTREPPERVLSVREWALSWIGSFSVLNREGAVLVVINRDFKSQEYRVRDRDGKVVLTLSRGEDPDGTRLGLAVRALALFFRAYVCKQMGHEAFLGGYKHLAFFRPCAGSPDSHTRIGCLEITDHNVSISFSDSELSDREKMVALVLGAIVLRG